jgi:hypothetical protein
VDGDDMVRGELVHDPRPHLAIPRVPPARAPAIACGSG